MVFAPAKSALLWKNNEMGLMLRHQTHFLQYFSEFIQKSFFSPGVHLEKHSLASARGHRAKVHRFALVLKQRYTETYSV